MREAEAAPLLVAGVGNIFLGDDGFGVEVVAQLGGMDLPPSVRLMDVGTRSIHLLYELLDRPYRLAILIDIVSRGGPPGTLYVLEPDDCGPLCPGRPPDAHSLPPDQVVAMARQHGSFRGRVLIVGCEPSLLEPDAGLSPMVREAVSRAAGLVLELIHDASGHADARRRSSCDS